MGLNKKLFGLMSVLLSAGLLFGCGTGGDEQEPDPTEEPSEQQDQNED
ncbi:LptM family lipoprotein [Bhargavaea cecembensis]